MMKLKQNIKTRKLDGFNLEICEASAPRCIVVSSDAPIRSIEAVTLYFEREQIGGGPLKRGKMDETEDGCLLLEFEDPRGTGYLWNRLKNYCSRLCKTGYIFGMVKASPLCIGWLIFIQLFLLTNHTIKMCKLD